MSQILARPTTYNGIKMRSRLEAGFAQWLDRMQLPWVYEPECFADQEYGQWLPDFAVTIEADIGASGQGIKVVLIDVKPSTFVADPRSAADEIARWLGIMVHQPEPIGWPYAAVESMNTGLVHSFGDDLVIQPWLTRVQGGLDGLGLVGLGSALDDVLLPWHGEWWKG